METHIPEQPVQNPVEQEKKNVDSNLPRIMALVLVIGFIGGAAGGVLGYRYAANGSAGGGVFSQQVKIEEDSAVIDVVKKASPAVVSIVISKDLNQYGASRFNDPFYEFFGIQSQPQPNTPNVQKVGAGSGFFVSSDGLIFTNRHVVSDEQASYTVITNDGTEYPAQVLTRDPVNDLAIIKIDIKNAPTLSFADTSSLQVGSRVVAIGNSLGQYQNTVTTGVISGIGRSIVAGGSGAATEQLEGVIQTDAAINPGNSGGPLLSSEGSVVGINTAIDQQGQSVGFAIPAGDARRALLSFQKSGKITRPYLGVRYVIVTKSVAEKQKLAKDYGALVIRGDNPSDAAILPGSPAEKAGIKENDILLEMNGKRIDQQHTLVSLLKDVSPGDTVRLKIFRDNSEQELSITVGER
jgi:serine protease Do